jgi:hypothetical protein
MQKPYENNLFPMPEDLIKIIGSTLPQISLKAVVQVSKSGYSLFQPDHLLGSLLWYVAAGEQDNAQRILEKYPELLSKRGTVTDYSGRTFPNITAWELMRWYGDTRHMGNMLLDCLPKDEQGEVIRSHLVAQDKQFDKLGVVYALEGKNFRDTSFNYSPLIKAYEKYIANYDAWTPDERITHCCTKVGWEQRYVPVHVANHYCDTNTSFYPTPTFNETTLKRTLSFQNYLTGGEECWWYKDTAKDNLLGGDFGIRCVVRGGGRRGAGVGGTQGWRVTTDLAAIQALCKIRATTDLESLNQRLKTPIQKMETELGVIS